MKTVDSLSYVGGGRKHLAGDRVFCKRLGLADLTHNLQYC
jgi:hypothetical protein